MTTLDEKDIGERARLIAVACHDIGDKGSLNSVRLGIQHFVADGDWRNFYCIDEHWTFSEFHVFCDEWLKLPLLKMRMLFSDEPDVIAIIDYADSKVGRNEYIKSRARPQRVHQVACR